MASDNAIMIVPLPEEFGYGFSSYKRRPDLANSYREEQVGNYWNYHFHKFYYAMPLDDLPKCKFVIDGFSPNLNKSLHVGHLRQLAIAVSLSRILKKTGHDVKMVSLLGASQGVLEKAFRDYQEWCSFLDYSPTNFYDIIMPTDSVECTLESDGQFAGCKIYEGKKTKVVVVRSDGRPTYTFYDISFAKNVAPTHYITGDEQMMHFDNLGLGEKHLAVGLVVGSNGKKIKSRAGENIPFAEEILTEIQEKLDETPNRKKLAWNIICWNFLKTSRKQSVKYELEKWTNPDLPGMYISYTYARVYRALFDNTEHCSKERFLTEQPFGILPEVMTDDDFGVLGISSYVDYYLNKSVQDMDSVSLAKYAHTLARKLGTIYHKEKIKDGRKAFHYVVFNGLLALRKAMLCLGMFPLETV